MKKVGIFGGSFNPIHNGHISLARQLLRLAGLDEVWLMVSPQNPLKPAGSLLSDELRLLLARRATEGMEGIRVSDYEMHLPRPSYTWDTLQSLSGDFPDESFTLLIGADNWRLFPRWYRADDIVAHYPIAVYPRRGDDINPSTLPPTVTLVPARLLDVSSTLVRQRVAAGLPVAHLVPSSIAPLVEEYYAPKA